MGTIFLVVNKFFSVVPPQLLVKLVNINGLLTLIGFTVHSIALILNMHSLKITTLTGLISGGQGSGFGPPMIKAKYRGK